MKYPVLLAFAVFLIVIQTVILPELFGAPCFYDLVIPFAVYFSLHRPVREGLPVLLLTGIMMDMLSAAPIGTYLIVYMWLYAVVRQAWRVVRIKQNVLFPFVVVTGVLFENIVFWIVIILQNGVPGMFSTVVKAVGVQLLWAVVTSPVLLVVLHTLFRVSDRLGAGNLQENGPA